jgi:glycosyltransferase involved in cell wall biosynthesis
VDSAEVASIYAASRLVVDPVLDDDTARARSPLKIVESLAMGVPVVTGDTGDRSIMLGGGRAGVLVKPGSPEALAEGIVSALNDQERYECMTEQARLVSQQFRWDRLAQEFVKVYTS